MRAVHAALWWGCLLCTQLPTWGGGGRESSTQPGVRPLSSLAPALGTGLRAPQARQAWAGPAPHQLQLSREPRGPAASPGVPWASRVHVAGQEGAVSPGYILLPGIRCKGALPAKAAESSRNGSQEGRHRDRSPPPPVPWPSWAASPPPSPSSGLSPIVASSSTRCSPGMPVAAAAPLRGPVPGCRVRGG